MPERTPPTRRSAAASAAVRDWSGYFDAVADAGPRETLVMAADRFDAERAVDPADPPLAVDLGCGTGRDTLELLERGWRVLALDGEQEAIDRMLARPEFDAFGQSPRLEARVASFDNLQLPPCMLVNASYALPFCPPNCFDAVWQSIVSAMRPGGRFAGQFLGKQDGWAKLPDRSHHTREEVSALLAGFEIEHLQEDLYGPDADALYKKRWHVFHIVARMPAEGI
ncbi:MAG: class I SAM-dependent methyltransferase [Planctomycetota bacterium]|jgi:SAM-dependent methyltransferase